MKIGIITLPLDFNYGGILQAYALEEVLRREGHQVEHIELSRPLKLLPFKTRYLVYFKRFVQKYILGKNVRVFQESYLYKTNKQVTQNTTRFINTYINRRIVSSYSDLKESDYETLIVGSDQVWRPSYMKQLGGYATFLDFAKDWNVRKLAYACSFGSGEWDFTAEETSNLAALLNQFNKVTVREASGVDLCRNYLHIDSQQVLDPTMLLDKADYEQLINNIDTNKSLGDMMCYVLDETPEKTLFIKSIAHNYNLTPFKSNSKAEDRWAPVEERIQPPVEQWLRGFADAKLVITDSFHACVFSIIFNKPFICLINKKRGADRFITLLSIINQDYRLVDNNSINHLDGKCFDKPNPELSTLKEESITILRKIS